MLACAMQEWEGQCKSQQTTIAAAGHLSVPVSLAETEQRNRDRVTDWPAVVGGWHRKQMSILQFQLQSKERGLKPHSKWCSSIIVPLLVFYMVIYYLFISSFCGMSASFSQLAHLTWMYDFIVSLSNRSTTFTSSVRVCACVGARVWGNRLY